MDNNRPCINNPLYIYRKNINKESEFFKYDISYPILMPFATYFNTSFYNMTIINKINQTIYNDIIKYKNEIKKQSKEYEKEYINIFSKSKEDYVKYQYELIVDYKVTYNKNHIISIPIQKYEFTGGAHGMTYLDSYNYDLRDGKRLRLSDMFKKDVDYKKIVDTFIEESINKNKELYFQDEGKFTGISDSQQFYIEDDGVVVYFNLYDIAPYYVGIPKFKLTFDEFGECFNIKYICRG
ncbi:DUF3298 and DUF4163 domain-containing protein [[Clostridium] dakarense]|uniref:DUF3298 and DUF4163 domain-containing protein n=1 Tax=Faecalimicrobium dakarense TaxID=1301100 RepID=UPI0004B2F884|nr:DUF3298 and DUF4163 domain-containing protein [[Clostridium] dakarense]